MILGADGISGLFSGLAVLCATCVGIVLIAGLAVAIGALVRRNCGSQAADRHTQVKHGATLIQDGYEYYADWRMLMVAAFNDSIERHLADDYAVARSIANMSRSDWDELISDYITGSTTQA